jgi:hypothetical protein
VRLYETHARNVNRSLGLISLPEKKLDPTNPAQSDLSDLSDLL